VSSELVLLIVCCTTVFSVFDVNTVYMNIVISASTSIREVRIIFFMG